MARRPNQRVERETDARPTEAREVPDGLGDNITPAFHEPDGGNVIVDGDVQIGDGDGDTHINDSNVTTNGTGEGSSSDVAQGDGESINDESEHDHGGHTEVVGDSTPGFHWDLATGMWVSDEPGPIEPGSVGHVGDGSGTEIPPPSDGPPAPETPDFVPGGRLDPDAENPGANGGFGAGSVGGEGDSGAGGDGGSIAAPAFGSGSGLSATPVEVADLEPASTAEAASMAMADEPIDLTEPESFSAEAEEAFVPEVVDDDPGLELDVDVLE